MGRSAARAWRDIHADEAGPFEKRVEVAHDGERFDPGTGAELATFADEPGGETGAAVRRMEDHPADGGDLRVVNLPLGAGPATAEAEVMVPAAQGLSGRGKDADADVAVAVTQEGHLPDAGDIVPAVVPAGEGRPVGRLTDDGFKLVVERDRNLGLARDSFDGGLLIQFAEDDDVRLEVFQKVIVRRSEEAAEAVPTGEPAEVERDDLREGAIQNGGEFVGHEPGGLEGRGAGEAVAEAFAVAQFTRRAEHEAGFAEPAAGEELAGRIDREPRSVNDEVVAEIEAVDPDGALKLLGGSVEQTRFAGAGRSEKEDDVAGLEGEFQVFSDEVPCSFGPDPEAVHDQCGMAGGTMRREGVGEGEEHGGEWMVAIGSGRVR